MPNNFPSVQEIKKTLEKGIDCSYMHKEQINEVANTLHSLFTSYLDSIGKRFPEEIVIPQKEWENMSEGQRDYVKGGNQALSLCKSYHIKVVAKLQEGNSFLREQGEEYLKSMTKLENQCQQKDKEIERFREALEVFANWANRPDVKKCKDGDSIVLPIRIEFLRKAQQALEGK
jgi:hypothetical protein